MVNNLIVSVRSNTTNLNITAVVYSASEFSFNFAVKTEFLQYDKGNKSNFYFYSVKGHTQMQRA
jgi:hypothetical protein